MGESAQSTSDQMAFDIKNEAEKIGSELLQFTYRLIKIRHHHYGSGIYMIHSRLQALRQKTDGSAFYFSTIFKTVCAFFYIAYARVDRFDKQSNYEKLVVTIIGNTISQWFYLSIFLANERSHHNTIARTGKKSTKYACDT